MQARFQFPAAVVPQGRLIRRDVVGERALAASPEFVRALHGVPFGGLPGAGEGQRLVVVSHEVGEDSLRLAVVRLPAFRAAVAVVLVLRRVPEEPVGRAGATGVLVHEGEGRFGLAGHGARVFDGVADGRRTADELRGGIEPVADSRESAEDERDVAAEDAAILVNFVDDDRLQPLEKPVPQAVGVREQGVVEHVGRREDDGRPSVADGPLFVLVESSGVLGHRDATAEPQVAGEFGERLLLVVDEGVLRRDVEGSAAVVHGAFERGNRVREALSARGSRGDDGVFPAANRFDGLGLMPVESLDAAPFEGRCQS